MTKITSNSKRIATNTLLLYFRMIFLILINLYTSRIVLDVLGVTDFGIYNVIGGIVILFSFLNNSMATASQRFLSFELGKENPDQLNLVFNTALRIHLMIGILVLITAELLGPYFIREYLVIPDNRFDAALFTYHISLIYVFIKIIQVPFTATIIANENMKFFAYISIGEGIFTLLAVFLIRALSWDKLIIYSLSLSILAFIILVTYYIYCRKTFKETKINFIYHKETFNEMLKFSSWSLIGNLSFVARTQGTNVVLNMFFNPAINAARAISMQIHVAVQSFVLNFQKAVNPQIVKSYASNQQDDMMKLVFISSKYSFLLLLILGLPLIFEIEQILQIWLKEVPQFTEIFSILIIIELLILSFSGPLNTAIHATGKIKKYEVLVGSILITNLPISYTILQFGGEPYTVFIVSIIITSIASILRVLILNKLIHFNLKEYFWRIILKNISIAVVVATILYSIVYYFPPNFLRLLCTIITSTTLIAIGIALTFTSIEKQYIINMYKNFRSKRSK